MSVEHILLGVLAEPSTGYHLKKVFDEVFSHFWAAEQSQIYRTLKSLEERGLVSSSEAPSDKGPPRRLYRRTAAGRRQLLDWLAAGPEIPTLRFPYLAQLFFLPEIDDLGKTEEWLTEMVAEMEARMAVLEELDAQFHADHPRTPQPEGDGEFHAYLVLRHGLTRTRAALEWARDSLDRTRERRSS